MTFLYAVLALIGSLVLQAGLGQWAPHLQRYVDTLLLPVAWYALARSQRSAMVVGCAAGLLQDAWFQTGAFGIHGFSKTLLGWALGGLGARFDLNHFWGQLVGGAFLFAGDRLVEMGLLLLMDQAVVPLEPGRLAIGAAVNALLVSSVFAIVRRGVGRERTLRPVRRRA